MSFRVTDFDDREIIVGTRVRVYRWTQPGNVQHTIGDATVIDLGEFEEEPPYVRVRYDDGSEDAFRTVEWDTHWTVGQVEEFDVIGKEGIS